MSEASATLGAYARERERLLEEAEPGLEAACALSKATDEAVAALAAAASLQPYALFGRARLDEDARHIDCIEVDGAKRPR